MKFARIPEASPDNSFKPSCCSFRAAAGVLIAACVLISLSGRLSYADKVPTVARAPFGFSDLEIYRASDESVSLCVHDLDNDGLKDLIFAFNTDTSIRLLYQRAAKERASTDSKGVKSNSETSTNPSTAGEKNNLNEVPFDNRFRSEKIYTEKVVYSLVVGDFGGDERPDIAYYGDPKELVVLYQDDDWTTRTTKFPIADGLESTTALRAVDINGDNKLDLALLGAGKLYLLKQKVDDSGKAGLGEPEELYNSARKASGLEIVDVNGDGLLDLVTISPRASHPVTIRLQKNQSFGPDFRVKMSPFADVLFRDIDGDGKVELLGIQGNTRRILVYQWRPVSEKPQFSLKEPRLLSYRPDGAASSRRVAFGDVNDDGRSDLIVTYGDLAEADVSLQGDDGKLKPPVRSPVLSDIQGLTVGNFDGIPGNEVIFASVTEKVIGRSRWQDRGRLSIPENEALPGLGDKIPEPLLVARFPLPNPIPEGMNLQGASPGQDLIFNLLRLASGHYRLLLLSYGDQGHLLTHLSRDMKASAQPRGVQVLDINGDGLQDLIVFIPYDNPKVFLSGVQDGALAFNEVSESKDFGISQLAKLEPKAVSVARFPAGQESDEKAHSSPGAKDLMIASKSHARALRFTSNGRLEILEQFSSRGTSANILGALAINLDADEAPEVLTFDGTTNAVDLLDRGERDIYRHVRSIDMGGIGFEGFDAQDVDGDSLLDVVIYGSESIAVLLRGQEADGFVQCAEFDPGDESYGRVEDFGKPYRMVLGDLNQDDLLDLGFVTDSRYYFTIVQPETRSTKTEKGTRALLGKLVPKFRFQIFEEKSYMRRGNESYGPRQLVVSDVTGDDKDDLVMLIHDRILLYVQE